MLHERISVKLEDVCAHITDGKHGDCQPENNSGFYFISCKDVLDGKIRYENARQITEADFIDTHKRTRLEPSDILITNSGTIGRMAIVPNNALTSHTTFQKSVAILKPLPNKVESRFLYYQLQFDIDRLKEFAGGAAQKNLLLRDLRAFPVELPPLPVQRRIVGILSAYDELIENNQRRIKILEEMSRSLYREWFVHQKFPMQFETKNQSLQMRTFGDLCELIKESFKAEAHANLPLLDLSRIPQRSIAPSETGKPSELTTSRIVFEPGDTLFGAIRCYLHKVVMAHHPGVTNTSVLVLRPKESHFRSLVAIIASDTETIRWADTHSAGTKMPVINWGVFRTMPALLPSEGLAQQFEKIASSMFGQIGVLANQIQILRRTRDLLLPRLLSGAIELPDTDTLATQEIA
ncbi:MAG: restriction endonuclease subunit S [Nitrospira sp.]